MNRLLVLALFVCVCVVLSPHVVADDKKPEPKEPKGISNETLKAWSERGFNGGWMRQRQGTTWLRSDYPKGYDDAIPALWIRGAGHRRRITDVELKDLPELAVPFA